MTDLINGRTPEEIITGLKCEVPCHKCAYKDHNFMKDNSCSYYVDQDIIALIERLESERDAALAKVPRWISVKYRLPEKDDNVLISLCGCNVKQAVYRGDGVFEAAYADTYHSTDLGSIVLTHWMPTPKPMEVSE